MLRIIDKKSLVFIRDGLIFDSEIELALDISPAQGFYKPKWSGEITEDEGGNITAIEGEWVEGATQEEIDELKKPHPHEPTIEERLEQTEELLQTVTMAFTEYVFTQEMSDDS